MLENLYICIWKAVIIWDVKIKWLNPGITKRLRMNGSYNLWRTRGYCKWYAGYNLHALVRQSGEWPMLIACIFTITLTAAIIIAAFIPLASFYEHILLPMERRLYLWLKLSYKILSRTSSHLVIRATLCWRHKITRLHVQRHLSGTYYSRPKILILHP